MKELIAQAEILAARLKARGETISVAESSSGGLLSAALLAIPGASAYFLGGAVVYTAKARVLLMDLPREAVAGMRSASEPYALLLARAARDPAFPPPGACPKRAPPARPAIPMATLPATPAWPCPARSNRRSRWRPAKSDRYENMLAFAAAAMDLMLLVTQARRRGLSVIGLVLWSPSPPRRLPPQPRRHPRRRRKPDPVSTPRPRTASVRPVSAR